MQHNMASFPTLRYCEPSAYAEGFGTFWISSCSAGLRAARTATARFELAALRGNHVVRPTPNPLTETPPASQLVAFSVGASAGIERGEARG